MEKVPQPLNMDDKYLYGINIRLEVLIDQFGSLLEHIARKEGVTVESVIDERTKAQNTELQQVPPKSRKRG